MRDRAQSLQLLMYLGIALAYLIIIKFMSTALTLNPWGMYSWWAFLVSINTLFAGFIITAVMTRLVYPSISLEGKAFWILMSAPLRLRKLIRAKFWCWLPISITVAITLLLSGVFVVYPKTLIILATIYIGVFLSIGCTGLAIGIGAMFASFEWESPNQIAAGFGTLVLLLASLSLVVFCFAPASALYFIMIIPWNWEIFGGRLLAATIFSLAMIPFANILTASWAFRRGAAALAEHKE